MWLLACNSCHLVYVGHLLPYVSLGTCPSLLHRSDTLASMYRTNAVMIFCFPPRLDIEYRLENPGGEMIKLLQHWDVRTAVRCDCLPGWLAHYRLVKQRDKATEQGVLVRLYLICLSLLKPKTFPTPWQLQIIWNCTLHGLVNSWVILLAKYISAIPALSSCLPLFLFHLNGY